MRVSASKPHDLPDEPEPAAPVVEPKLPSGKDFNGHPFGKLDYAPASGRPLIHAVAPGDVGQGNLGDCFFLSSLAAVAETHPDLVRQAIRANPDGTYTVTLHGKDGKPEPVTVDGELPESAAGKQTFGRGLEGGELWPAIFEKAYAKLEGGYSVIDGGGFAKDALKALTGKPAHDRTLSTLSADAAWKLVTTARAAGQPIVTGTPDLAQLKKRTGSADLGGLLDDHAYTLLDAYEKDGQRFVRLYTPLLPADAEEGTPGEGRTIDLPLAEWQKDFDDVTVGEV